MRQFFLFIILTVFCGTMHAQGIGELAPDKDPIVFPPNAYGLDVMFGEGGFGLGGFYKHDLAKDLTFSVDLSVSEAKDENEFEYVDPYTGESYTYGKKNRVLLLPLNFGMQYRLFSESLGDNLRPYINIAAGPATVVTTPYDMEFFTAFKKAQARYTAGGYVGVGANFGLEQKNTLGINIRYYIIHFFDEGVESLEGRFQKNLGGFYITLNLGIMY